MSKSEQGSAVILFVTFLLPFGLLLLLAGIDVAQFYGLRENVRQILDSEARVSLARESSVEGVETRVRQRVMNAHPSVDVERVSVTGDARVGYVEISGRYHGFVGGVLSRMVVRDGDGVSGIPFSLSSRARKATSVALVVIDRGIVGVDPCADRGLRRRAMFAGALVMELRALGVSDIKIGVMPGINGSIDLLSLNGDGVDEMILRCPGVNCSLPYKLRRMVGMPRSVISDPLSVARDIVGTLLQQCGDDRCGIGPIEQRSLVVIGPATRDRTEVVSTALDLVSAEAARSSIKVSGVGVAVRPRSLKDEEGDIFPMKESNPRASVRYLDVSDDDIRSGPLRGAITQYLQGRTFISQ